MYISRKNHILTNALAQTAGINFAATALSAIARALLRNQLTPDMLNSRIVPAQTVVNIVKIILTGLVFINAFLRLKHLRSVVGKDDYSEMAKLQEEMNPGGISGLSTYSVFQLLQIWAFVLVGVSVVQETGAIIYQHFIALLFSDMVFINPMGFLTIYNLTHGFKYIGMLTAITVAIFATGIFIRDTHLKTAALCIMGLFMCTFILMEMSTVSLGGRNVNVVWTSVIYHIVETVGLLALAIYLRKK